MRVWMFKVLIPYEVDNCNFINMVSQLFVDYTSNIFVSLRPSTY